MSNSKMVLLEETIDIIRNNLEYSWMVTVQKLIVQKLIVLKYCKSSRTEDS